MSIFSDYLKTSWTTDEENSYRDWDSFAIIYVLHPWGKVFNQLGEFFNIDGKLVW